MCCQPPRRSSDYLGCTFHRVLSMLPMHRNHYPYASAGNVLPELKS